MALYNRLELGELISCCRNRGLFVPSDQFLRFSGRHWLINSLKKADRQAKFDKLFDFAPELRLKIYEFYFTKLLSDTEQYDSISAVGFVPPLCHASHTLRREALPVYFSYGIVLGVETTWGSFRKKWAQARFGSEDMGESIMTMPTHLFQHVRQVTIMSRFLYTGTAKTIWTIKLDAKTAALRMTTSVEEIKFTWAGPVDGTESEQSAETREVERGLQMLVAEIVGQDGNIRREDMQKILDMFQKTWESREKMLDEGKLLANVDY